MTNTKITAQTLDGKTTFCKKDKSITIENDKGVHVLNESKMQWYHDHFKGCQEIFKPLALLFWIDCKKGKAKNWNLV